MGKFEFKKVTAGLNAVNILLLMGLNSKSHGRIEGEYTTFNGKVFKFKKSWQV